MRKILAWVQSYKSSMCFGAWFVFVGFTNLGAAKFDLAGAYMLAACGWLLLAHEERDEND